MLRLGVEQVRDGAGSRFVPGPDESERLGRLVLEHLGLDHRLPGLEEPHMGRPDLLVDPGMELRKLGSFRAASLAAFRVLYFDAKPVKTGI